MRLKVWFENWRRAAFASDAHPTNAMTLRRPTYESHIWPAAVYAIGDVHGRLDLLLAMEQIITKDAATFEGEKWIVLLGDLIDRGPQSAEVIDYALSKPPGGLMRICVAGNHEAMMSSFLRGSYQNGWLESGGLETLESYGLGRSEVMRRLSRGTIEDLIKSHVPDEHVEFLVTMPKYVSLPGCALLHAIDRSGPQQRSEKDQRLGLVSYGLDYPLSFEDRLLIHGHEIVTTVKRVGNRVNVDTGAYLSGRLSAVRLCGCSNVGYFEVSVGDLGKAGSPSRRQDIA